MYSRLCWSTNWSIFPCTISSLLQIPEFKLETVDKNLLVEFPLLNPIIIVVVVVVVVVVIIIIIIMAVKHKDALRMP